MTLQEMLSELKEKFEKNSENIIIISVISLIIVIAIPLYIKHKANQEVKASGLVSMADAYASRPVVDTEEASMYGAFRTKGEKEDKILGTYMEVLQGYKGTKAQPLAYLGIANTYIGSGKYMEALDYLKTFTEKYPKHSMMHEALHSMGYAHYGMKKFEQAAAEWEKVIAQYPGCGSYYDAKLNLAYSYIKMGQKDKAKKGARGALVIWMILLALLLILIHASRHWLQ